MDQRTAQERLSVLFLSQENIHPIYSEEIAKTLHGRLQGTDWLTLLKHNKTEEDQDAVWRGKR